MKTCKQVRLSEKKIGEVVKIGTYEFIALEHMDGTTAVILKKLLKDNVRFGENNNDFRDSNVLPILREFAKEIEAIVGTENLIPHLVDLTSNDGLKDYGAITEKVSLLTAEQYRRYVDILDQERIKKWWWLATPDSTMDHGNDRGELCVSARGGIYYYCNDISYFRHGVRPFCILKSDIFVS